MYVVSEKCLNKKNWTYHIRCETIIYSQRNGEIQNFPANLSSSNKRRKNVTALQPAPGFISSKMNTFLYRKRLHRHDYRKKRSPKMCARVY